MASNLRVDNIQPSTGMGIGIGTANGSVTFNADVTGGLNVTTGSVGIGTDNPSQKLHVEGTILIGRQNTSIEGGGLVLSRAEDNASAYELDVYGTGTADATNFRIVDTVASAERLRITSTGDVQVKTGNLVFPTSGTGIDFSATSDGSGTVTAETLSEYEEGTWTPVLASLTGGTQPVVTTSIANGLYTRIGRMVYIEFLMIVTAVTTQGTGNIGVTGLPFTSSGFAYGNNIGITYNDIWDTAFREMYVTGSSLQMTPLGITQSNATYGGPSNTQGNLSTGYFSVAGWYMRS